MSQLVSPYGGQDLKPLILPEVECPDEIKRAKKLKKVPMASRETSDVIMMAMGAYTPLDGFMGESDWRGCCEDMKLVDGLFWPIPVTLATEPDLADSIEIGEEVALVDADSGEIIAHSLTNQETGDASQLEPLLDQIDDEIGQFTADGAYDGNPTYDAVLRHSPGAKFVIPPRSNAVERPIAQSCCQRDDHIASMQIGGRLKWQASTGYGKRALVETAMGKYKGIIGPRLRARSFPAQQTEAAIGVAILNRMLACGHPKSVRCQASAGATK